jgi:hypothetical protein
MCASACASRSRGTGMWRAACAPLIAPPPSPKQLLGEGSTPRQHHVRRRLRVAIARDRHVACCSRSAFATLPATAGGGQRRAAAPCVPPTVRRDCVRQARRVPGPPAPLTTVPPSDPGPAANPSRATGSAPDVRTLAILPATHGRDIHRARDIHPCC